jgi:hypothetical protein
MTTPGDTIDAAGTRYDRAGSQELREDLIARREQALLDGDMRGAVVLSHTIAWMQRAIERIWPR